MYFKSIGISFLFLLPLFGILCSCHKNIDFISVAGTLISINENITVQGVKVELYTKKIESGIYSAYYDLFDTIETDANGQFDFHLPNKTWASVKVYFSKSGYFNLEHEIEGDLLRSSVGFNEDFNIDPKAWLKLKIKNVDSSFVDDIFDYRIVNGTRNCDACCDSSKKLFEGKNVDEEIICRVVGHQEIMIHWNQTVEGKTTGRQVIYFVPAFDTTLIEFYY